ncbi:MAG: hypothetical protein KDA95_10625, partial [Acidimicrobiales bacterium]|nr:hypothetical protein [Acidimicrobiales bacterium]
RCHGTRRRTLDLVIACMAHAPEPAVCEAFAVWCAVFSTGNAAVRSPPAVLPWASYAWHHVVCW